jgi:tetratricopeptide (TPR) repeat protein
MAGVFLSYDRDDAVRARHFAQALERTGHKVWWDPHVRGGSEFSKVIEGALEAADAVVVLWSKESVESSWVRDEASAGRDRGRLVPVTIDGTKAPLGFRQFQTIDFSGWTGRGRSPRLNELMDAVNALTNGVRAETGSQRATIAPLMRERGLRWPLVASLAVALLVVVGLAAWNLMGRSSPVPLVAVAAADSSPVSQTLSRDLLVKLGSLQSVTANAMRLVEQRPGGEVPTLIFNIASSGSTDQPAATLALFDGKDRSLLWSKDFEQSSGKAADLKQQIAYTAALVLSCALEGLPTRGRHLDQQSLGLYLKGCAGYADKTADSLDTLEPLFAQLTRTAPTFSGGWAKLLLVEGEFARMSYRRESKAMMVALPAHIAAARKLEPEMPEALLAEATLVPEMAFERRIDLLERAVKLGPQNSAALAALSDNLLAVGRMNEAVDRARQAVQADPLSPAARDGLIAALIYAGKMDAALAELQRAEQLWPGASSVVTARYRINLRYGDPSEAVRLIRSGQITTADTPYVESFLEARMHPTPANVDRAVSEARSAYARQPTTIYHLAQVLGTFGREEELFPILISWPYPDKVSYVTDALFRPSLRKVRSDPRMIAIARRLGLLDYWRKTGDWPDFCFEPTLPYDCRKEAAQLT